MNLGEKIRDLRLKSGLTQEELADRCELTKGYISQLENEWTSPSISTLTDILGVLGITLGDFFKEDEMIPLRYQADDCFEKENDGQHIKWLVPSNERLIMEPMMITLSSGASTDSDQPHSGEEFGYVLSGKVLVQSGNRKEIIKKDESFYYDSGNPHVITNVGDEPAQFIWIIAGE